MLRTYNRDPRKRQFATNDLAGQHGRLSFSPRPHGRVSGYEKPKMTRRGRRRERKPAANAGRRLLERSSTGTANSPVTKSRFSA